MGLAHRVADFYPSRINMYCPAMQYSADLNADYAYSLGTPAAADNDIIDTDIDSDAVAGVETAQSWTADSPYGRTVTMNANADPGANGVVDVHGFDYLGQPMVERFSFATGVTPIMYGKKAFYRITKTVIVTPSVNATTYDLGTGLRLGLPFRAKDVHFIRENGVYVPYKGQTVTLQGTFDDADAASGGSIFLRSPVSGYITTLRGWHNVAGSTTDPVITVELATVAVVGLTITLDVSGTVGTVVTDTPTTAGYSANNEVVAGDLIEIVGAAATGANSYTIEVDIASNQVSAPDYTDPATATTGDPRGTYESSTVYDGVKEFEIGLVGDPYTNADGNGGLHGIRHYYA